MTQICTWLQRWLSVGTHIYMSTTYGATISHHVIRHVCTFTRILTLYEYIHNFVILGLFITEKYSVILSRDCFLRVDIARISPKQLVTSDKIYFQSPAHTYVHVHTT